MANDRPPFGIFTTDAQLVVRTWDPWISQITHIEPERALDRHLGDLFPDLAARGLLTPFHNALSRGTIEVLASALHQYLIECEPLTPTPGFRRMQQHVTIGPIREETAITGLVVTIEDVTAQVARERTLAQQLVDHESTVPPAAALTQLLGNGVWRDRRIAITTLAQHGQAIVGSLVETLRQQHHDFSVLSSAMDLLAISDIDIIEPLIGFLSDQDTNLRIQAALILGERRDARAIRPLMARLSDPDVNVQFHVIEALGRLQATEAADALLVIAERRDFFVSFPAIQALRHLGSAANAPRLVPLLADDMLRAPVAEVLGELGDEDVAVPLVELLNNSDAPPDVIAEALARLHGRYQRQYGAGEHIGSLVRRAISPATTHKLLEAVQEVASDRLPGLATVLGWLDGEAVQRELGRLLGHERVRSQVVEALVRHGEGVVPLLIEQLDHDDPDTRHAAVAALGRIGDRRATPALIASLSDPELTVPAAWALARIGDRQAFEPLLALVGQPDAPVRQAAIAALNSIGHPDMPGRVAQLLADPDAAVRESALRIAGYFGYPECLAQVLTCCRDEEALVRRAAIESLAFFEGPAVVETLVGALGHDSPAVRAAAATALKRVDDPAAVDALCGALRDADPWVRFYAIRSLGVIGTPSAAPVVLSALEHDPAPQVRIAAIETVGRLAVPDARQILEPLTRSSDRDICRAAIRALAHVDSGDVLGLLEPLLHVPDPEVRRAAVEAVASREESHVPELLQWVAVGDDDGAVKAVALSGLANSAVRETLGPAATKALIALTSLLPTREAAIQALSTLPLRRLEDIATGLRHPSPLVRCAIVQALSRMKRPEASRVLEAALDDDSRDVRLTAVVELKHLGAHGPQRKLLLMARTDADADVRYAARLAAARYEPQGSDPVRPS